MTEVNHGPVQVQCPLCREWLVAPSTVLADDDKANTVDLRLDATGLRKHLVECAKTPGARAATPPPTTSPLPAVVVPGARTCTCCGTTNAKCLGNLSRRGRKSCCVACANGNTHPSPGANEDCQVWGAKHGPKD